VGDLNPKEPMKTCAVVKDNHGRTKPAEGAVRIHNMVRLHALFAGDRFTNATWADGKRRLARR
jgi:hypothetical protein